MTDCEVLGPELYNIIWEEGSRIGEEWQIAYEKKFDSYVLLYIQYDSEFLSLQYYSDRRKITMNTFQK